MSSTASVLAPSSEAAHGLVDAERLRIARELHDVMSFSIATISVQAGAAAHVVDRRPDEAREALPAIKAISGEASRELRGILGLLRAAGHVQPSRHGLGGLDALAATATGAGLPTRVVVASGAEVADNGRGLSTDGDGTTVAGYGSASARTRSPGSRRRGASPRMRGGGSWSAPQPRRPTSVARW